MPQEITIESIFRDGTRPVVTRNNVTMINPYHFRHSEDALQDQQLAANSMDRLYASDPASHASLAAELTANDSRAGPYMLWEAFASGHREILKGLQAFTRRAGPDGGWDDSVTLYRNDRMQEVFSADADTKSAKITAWLEEFDDEQSMLAFKAAVNGDTSVLQYLIDAGTELHPASDPSCQTFHAACHNGQLSAATLLLESGIDANHTDDAGGTALMRAAVGSKPELVRFLLDRGANPHICETREGNYNALELGARDAEVVRMLLSAGVEFSANALAAAASFGNEDAFSQLLTAGKFPLPFAWEGVERPPRELPDLTTSQREALLLSLRHFTSTDPTKPDQLILHYILVHFAFSSAGGRYGFVSTTQPGSIDTDIYAALSAALESAVCSNDVPTTSTLLESMPDPETGVTSARDAELRTRQELARGDLIMWAARADAGRVAEYLLTWPGLDEPSKPSKSPEEGASSSDDAAREPETPLEAAASRGHVSTLRILLNHLQPDDPDTAASTPSPATPPSQPRPWRRALYFSIHDQHEPATRLLLTHPPLPTPTPPTSQPFKRLFLVAVHADLSVRAQDYFDRAWLPYYMHPQKVLPEETERFLCLEFPEGFDVRRLEMLGGRQEGRGAGWWWWRGIGAVGRWVGLWS